MLKDLFRTLREHGSLPVYVEPVLGIDGITLHFVDGAWIEERWKRGRPSWTECIPRKRALELLRMYMRDRAAEQAEIDWLDGAVSAL